mmetsp:Transcript_31553/g.49297  ORF Transcript_31553/g.49297 Transcript_31553/m.49297 type:complete len:147 (-) Transcript_31553:831-1271(-)
MSSEGGDLPTQKKLEGPDPEAVKQLSMALFLSIYPQLSVIESKLSEVQDSQIEMLTTLMNENEALKDNPQLLALQQIVRRIPEYRVKVDRLKTEMRIINMRTAELKQRSLALKEKKMKENEQAKIQRERENIRERELLAAKVAPKK